MRVNVYAEEMTDRIEVGDRVRGGEKTGTVMSDPPKTIYVNWDDGTCGRYSPDFLEPVPSLPDDHIDRHWIPGAKLASAGPEIVYGPDDFWLVLDDGWCVFVWRGSSGAFQAHTTRRDALPATGWSFHPDSALQAMEGE